LTPELQNQIRQISGKIETEYKKKLKLNRNSIYAVNLVANLQSSVDVTVQEAKNLVFILASKKDAVIVAI
jgi:hypothetical protein